MAGEPRFELDTRIRVRRGLGAWLIVPAAAVCAIAASGVWWLLVPLLVVFISFRARRGSIVPAHVVASPEGLQIGDRLVPRAELDRVAVRHEEGATFVAFPAVEVEVENNLRADDLLRALDLDAKKAAVEFRLVALSSIATLAVFAIPMVLAVGLIVLSFTGVRVNFPLLFGTAIATLCAIAAVQAATLTRLRVGADGITIHSLGRRVRFVSHDAIRTVSAEGDALTLEKNDGSRLRFTPRGYHHRNDDVRTAARFDEARTDEALAIVRRIREARNAFRELDQARGVAMLAREGGLTTREWMDRLRAIGTGAADTFRSASLTRAQLFRVVESASASARERIAATIALRSTLTTEEAPRIRIAAERCVLPALRERMVRILETDDDDALAREIEEAEADTRVE